MRAYQKRENHPMRVAYQERLRFEAELREAVNNEPDMDTVCANAFLIGREYEWATASTVAKALVNISGVGWDAIYLHWLGYQSS